MNPATREITRTDAEAKIEDAIAVPKRFNKSVEAMLDHGVVPPIDLSKWAMKKSVQARAKRERNRAKRRMASRSRSRNRR